METYQKFLFYYSLTVSSFLLVVSFFFLPQPQNLLTLTLFVPITLYFWFKFTLTKEKSPYRWSLKMLGLLLITGLLGVFAFWLVGRKPAETPTATLSEATPTPVPTTLGDKDNQPIMAVLEEIKTEMAQIKAEQRATREILGITNSATQVSDILNTILEQASGSGSP